MEELLSPRQPGWRAPRAMLALVRRHAVPVCAFFLAFTLSFFLGPVSPRLPLAVFIGAVIVSAWRAGPPAGLFTTAVSAVGLLLLPHLHAHPSPDGEAEHVPRLAMFVLVGLLASFLAQQCKRAVQVSEQIESILSSLGSGLIFADVSGQITFQNGLAQSLTGWKAAEAKGKTLDAVFLLIHEQTRERLPLPTAEVLRSGNAFDVAGGAVLISTTGCETPVEGTITPVRAAGGRITGMALTFRDATSRRQSERDGWRALQECKQRASAALGQVQDAVARAEHAEQAAQSAQQALEGLSAERERTEKALQDSRDGLQRQLEERMAAQQRAEEALRKAREGVEKQRAEQAAARKQSDEELRAAREALQRQRDEGTAAQQRAEEALRRAGEDFARQLAEHRQARELAESELQKSRQDGERPLADLAAEQQRAEETLHQARAEWERQLAEQTAGREHAEEVLRQLREDSERLLAERTCDLRRTHDELQQRLEEQENDWQRAREDLQRQLTERTRELQRLKAELATVPSKGSNGEQPEEMLTNGHADGVKKEAADWLTFN